MSTVEPVESFASENPISLLSDGDIDPITFSVILNRFNTIAREMTLTLEYTAWTSILALARDFSCAIYDAKARQVCMMDALPIHTNSLHVILRSMVRAFEGNEHSTECQERMAGGLATAAHQVLRAWEAAAGRH
jgi:hypothetical protein